MLVTGSLRAARASEPATQLPNLVADPPDNASLVASDSESGAQLLLRFNGYVHNSGPGALDIRASRPAPAVKGKTTQEVQEEVASYQYREASLPAGLEEELATPEMNVSQRLFTSNEGNPVEPEKYLARPHVDQASTGEILYSNADGHHHWHLQHVARYSLWNASRTAEVATAQKVGFCLQDSQHVELSQGPSAPVYTNVAWPYSHSCRRFEPNATSLYEGISPGWRDIYGRELAFQWIDASDVLPGEYWLREDIDPTRVIKQAGGGPLAEYSRTATTIPGFDAEPQIDALNEGEQTTVNLGSRAYEDQATPIYRLLSQPQHGTLGAVHGSEVTYTPAAGYSGTDSFTFTAQDPSSPFPAHAAVASVSIAVRSRRPSIAISGAQAEMTAGTSVQLTATVTNDSGGVEWEATAGTFTPQGAGSLEGRFVAPSQAPPGGLVTITARLRDDPSVSDQRTIVIAPVPDPEPQPEPEPEPHPEPQPEPHPQPAPGPHPEPGPQPQAEPLPNVPPQQPSGGGAANPPATSGTGAPPSRGSLTAPAGAPAKTPAGGFGPGGVAAPEFPRPDISGLRVMLFGRILIMTAVPSTPGGIRLSAFAGARRLGTCATETPAGRSFTCRVHLTNRIWRSTPIRVQARLRSEGELALSALSARRVAGMETGAAGRRGHAAGACGVFWCASSALLGALGEA